MEDRELLEMAAKAAGIEFKWRARKIQVGMADTYGVRQYREEEQPFLLSGVFWDPLNDDGAALRLAIGLDIHVKRYSGSTTAQEWASCLSSTEHDHWSINSHDKMKSTRRSIVRAAAAIGKAMP